MAPVQRAIPTPPSSPAGRPAFQGSAQQPAPASAAPANAQQQPSAFSGIVRPSAQIDNERRAAAAENKTPPMAAALTQSNEPNILKSGGITYTPPKPEPASPFMPAGADNTQNNLAPGLKPPIKRPKSASINRMQPEPGPEDGKDNQ